MLVMWATWWWVCLYSPKWVMGMTCMTPTKEAYLFQTLPNRAQKIKNKLPPKKKQFLFRFSPSVRCRCGAQEQAERHDTDSTCAIGLQLRVETYLQESLSFPGFLSWRVPWCLNQRRCCLMFLEESSSLGDSVYTYTMQYNIYYIYVYIYTDYRIWICRHNWDAVSTQ